MKLCIIALPRSRSSVLLETMSNFYKIPILGQDIGMLKHRFGHAYITILKNLLNKNSMQQSGVMRLHPLQMVCTRPVFRVLDFEWFNFSQYDRIYFTYRESVTDNIASNFIATRLGRFTYKSDAEIYKNLEPFFFSESDYYHVRDYIQSINIMTSLKKYLSSINVASEDIYYNDVPDYLQQRYPGINSSHVETHYDYRKLISNYDDITEVYKRKQNEIPFPAPS